MKRKTILLPLFLLLVAILIGWLIIQNQPNTSIPTNLNTVILRLPTENDKILEYKEKIIPDDNVFLLLKRVTERENITLKYKENDDGFIYVYQIGQTGGIIMDCNLVLLVNNKEVLETPDKYFLTPTDEIEWVFRCADK
jgi:hypothetical protein